jgi:hypothetical protein
MPCSHGPKWGVQFNLGAKCEEFKWCSSLPAAPARSNSFRCRASIGVLVAARLHGILQGLQRTYDRRVACAVCKVVLGVQGGCCWLPALGAMPHAKNGWNARLQACNTIWQRPISRFRVQNDATGRGSRLGMSPATRNQTQQANLTTQPCVQGSN